MKNSRKREAALVASGIVLGVAIVGPTAQAAEMLTAQRSTQKICVDGQQVQMEAYSISGSKYVPRVGDRILCDDGMDYAITDVRKWELNISTLPDLPSATCDWSKFPILELPQAEARHFTDQGRDILFVKNLYEMRRMQYTIYNALDREPSAWKNGKPLTTVQLTIPADLDPYTASMWPWHASDLEELVHSRTNSEYYIEAWDYYLNGVFQHTRYCVVSL